jgi:hypothetical protein
MHVLDPSRKKFLDTALSITVEKGRYVLLNFQFIIPARRNEKLPILVLWPLNGRALLCTSVDRPDKRTCSYSSVRRRLVCLRLKSSAVHLVWTNHRNHNLKRGKNKSWKNMYRSRHLSLRWPPYITFIFNRVRCSSNNVKQCWMYSERRPTAYEQKKCSIYTVHGRIKPKCVAVTVLSVFFRF